MLRRERTVFRYEINTLISPKKIIGALSFSFFSTLFYELFYYKNSIPSGRDSQVIVSFLNQDRIKFGPNTLQTIILKLSNYIDKGNLIYYSKIIILLVISLLIFFSYYTVYKLTQRILPIINFHIALVLSILAKIIPSPIILTTPLLSLAILSSISVYIIAKRNIIEMFIFLPFLSFIILISQSIYNTLIPIAVYLSFRFKNIYLKVLSISVPTCILLSMETGVIFVKIFTIYLVLSLIVHRMGNSLFVIVLTAIVTTVLVLSSPGLDFRSSINTRVSATAKSLIANTNTNIISLKVTGGVPLDLILQPLYLSLYQEGKVLCLTNMSYKYIPVCENTSPNFTIIRNDEILNINAKYILQSDSDFSFILGDINEV